MHKGFWKKGSAGKCAALEEREDLQLSAQIRTVILKSVEYKRSYVDVATTLGVNHIYLVLWWFLLVFVLLCFMHLISR